MTDVIKERRCKTCGKLLIDEKLPVCRRCKLQGRNTVRNVCGVAAGAALTLFSSSALLNQNKSNDNDDDKDEGKDK